MAGLDEVGEDFSDDEVFFGKMTIKEVKKHIWLNHGHKDTSHNNITSHITDRNSIKIIETHSEPNLRSGPVNSPSPPTSARDNRTSDGSFIQMENLVSKMCLSPEKAAELELNNTLDIVDFILNNGPDQFSKPDIKIVKTEDSEKINTIKTDTEKEVKTEKMYLEKVTASPKEEFVPTCNSDTGLKPKTEYLLPKACVKKEYVPNKSTPKVKSKTPAKASPKYYTPAKSPRKQADVFLTPSSNIMEVKTPFKTPTNPRSMKTPSASSLKNVTPSRSLMYKHIKSPIASYIKGSIEVPMVTNVCPKKPLPGGSLIPKLVKREPQGKQNKENVNLPTTAYKSARKTRVIHVPDEEKPKIQVAKKLLSTLPDPPLVLKHEIREFNSARKPLVHLQEDTIADQSCLQADLSVCTQVKHK